MFNNLARYSGHSVTAKVQAVIQLTGALAILVVGAFQFWYNLQVFQSEIQSSLEKRVKLTVFHSVAPLDFDDSPTAEAAVSYLAEDDDVLSARILRADGSVLADFQRDTTEIAMLPFGGFETYISEPVYSPDGMEGPDSRLVGSVTVTADLSARVVGHALNSLARTISIMGLAFLAAFLFSRILLRRVLRPVFQLTETVQRIGAEGKFDLRAKKMSNDEFGVLVEQFNAMLDQIHDRDLALAESEAQYRSLVNNINVGICLISADPALPPLRANPAAARIFGFDSPEALCSTSLVTLCIDDSDWSSLLSRTQELGAVKNREIPMRNQGGGLRWISFSAQRESGGELLNCVLEDITEQREAQEELLSYRNHLEVLVGRRTEELEESNRLLSSEIADRITAEEALVEELHFEQALLDSLPTPVSVKDVEKRYLGCNDAFEALVGLDKSRLIGRGVEAIAAPSLVAAEKAAEDQTIGDDAVHYLERDNDDPNGVRRIFQIQKSHFQNSDGTRGGEVTTFHDVTALKEAEERSRTSKERMEAINEELKTFAYIVSHDLRAPLTNINGFARELRADLEALNEVLTADDCWSGSAGSGRVRALLERDIPESIDFIGHSVLRMEELVGAIFKLSRLGQRVLHFERVDMDGLVNEILRSFAHVIEEKRVRVDLMALPEINADHVAIGQIVANLIDNALKYLDPERPGILELGAEVESNHYAFYVRDNGKGISDADSQTIFDMFRRGGDQAVPGEGIGLTFVRMLVRRHGGELRCESTLGAGSCFRFTIAKDPQEQTGGRY